MAVSPQPTKLLVGYFPGWAIHARNYHVSDIPADKLTHVNYAFAGISGSGDCISIRPQDDQINFPSLQQLKRQYSSLKTLIAIGGASHSDNFSKATSTLQGRQHLAQSCVTFMKSSGFDGIDIDWEFPEPTDTKNFTALLLELRSELDAQGAIDNKRYLLSAALPADQDHYSNFEVAAIAQFVDWINLMAYDFYTASSSRTHFSAPLFASSSDPEPDPKKRLSYNVDAAVRAYLSAGVPAAKIIVGVAFFGYGWEGVSSANHGLYQPASGAALGTWSNDGVFDFQDLNSNYVGTYLRFWGNETSVPWLYNPDTGIMISYDDAQSLGLKADYVNSNKLGGVMIWPLSADDAESSLVNALSSRLSPAQTGQTAPLPQSRHDSSTRRIPKATYVPLKIPEAASLLDTGAALQKSGFVRRLSLQPGEVDAVRRKLTATGTSTGQPYVSVNDATLWDTLRSFEGAPMPSQLPSPTSFAKMPLNALLAFGKAIVDIRRQAVDQLKQQTAGSELLAGAPAAQDLSTAMGKALNLLNSGITATNGFEANVTASPIGMLNLERLEMTPAGIERGELLATIPLAPKERTAVVQKEWSVTTKEFTSIVTDSLENYSETGVTDNTELAQSTTSQTQHSNQFNINATVSGGIGFVSGSVSTSFGTQDSSSQSATDSRKRAIDTTRKASSRVKQEHKMTISTTTVTGTSETTTRILENPSATDPIRIDYFSMMRKWHVGLYRYGLRLTYDIGIPEPAGAMRAAYRDLANLQAQASKGFTFPLTYSDITPQTYGDPTSRMWSYASQWGAQVQPPPDSPIPLMVSDNNHPGSDGAGHDKTFAFDVQDGYYISVAILDAQVWGNTHDSASTLFVFYGGQSWTFGQNGGTIHGDLPWLHGMRGHISLLYLIQNASGVDFNFTITQTVDPSVLATWQSTAWSALYNAGQTAFYAQQQAINAQISALQEQINNVDTLTLRREENDEIMKGILRWVLGTSFEFMPQDVIDLFVNGGGDLTHGVSFTGNDLGPLGKNDWTTMFQYQEMVKFINEAIEWENVLYFLYSYFWDVPVSWDFIRQIRHPDSTRQAFLRAGSARVVLTVRKGWELAWVSFVETGGFESTLIPGHPYMSIAEEIAAYDNTNYPGIPPANPASDSTTVDPGSIATTSSASVPASPNAPATIAVDSSAGFAVGYVAVIDDFIYNANDPTKNLQEAQIVTAIPDGTHITVQRLDKPHDGTTTPFPVLQPGEKGVLISEWFEYTPTSGTDIAVTSNLATIA
jgi:GH18 family chitinase